MVVGALGTTYKSLEKKNKSTTYAIDNLAVEMLNLHYSKLFTSGALVPPVDDKICTMPSVGH